MKSIKFKFDGKIYPMVIAQEFDHDGGSKNLQYERFITIYPNPDGDYDMAEIDSAGGFELLKELSVDDVEIIT